MTIDSEKLRKYVIVFRQILKGADKIRSYVYSEGEDMDGGLNEYAWIEKVEDIIDELEDCNWDIKTFFNTVATEDCSDDDPDIINKGTIPYAKGWEKVVDEIYSIVNSEP